ncbi:MAG: hypothetical protein HY820_13875 [Acidobacteria bacterium]|nr:hypothetical protein [Acidobacteriota bacterium]
MRAEPTPAALKKALGDRNNYLVSKAAALVGELRITELAPDLVSAFHRFLGNPVKTDTQCWAKNAIAKALKDFEYEDPELYITGLRHVQMEPVFGGQEDTAITLRGTCGLALAVCRSLSDLIILRHLTGLLTDPAIPVRRDAARAVAQLGRAEGALLLRLRIGCGDQPEVIGECFSALLSLEEREAIPLVSGYLQQEFEDTAFEAAAALGETTSIDAFDALAARDGTARSARFREALLLAIGATRRAEAVDYLIALIHPSDAITAGHAIAALGPSLLREEVRERVEEAVQNTNSAALRAALRKACRE